MNQALKQRLVGALVLVALGIIFLPSLFNGGRSQQATEVLEKIPPAPTVSPIAFKEPIRNPKFEKSADEPVAEMYQLEPRSSGGEKQPEKSLSLNDKGLPLAWVLQVASFSDRKKAEALKKSLQEKGYKAFTRTIKKEGKQLSRVIIGPEMDAKKLSQIKKSVDKAFNVKSLIIKFES